MNYPLTAAQASYVEHRRNLASQADYCVKWLQENGLEVIAISDGPRITVRNSPLCNKLEGAVQGYSRGPKGVEHYKTVIRFDCEIRWKIEVGS